MDIASPWRRRRRTSLIMALVVAFAIASFGCASLYGRSKRPKKVPMSTAAWLFVGDVALGAGVMAATVCQKEDSFGNGKCDNPFIAILPGLGLLLIDVTIFFPYFYTK